MFAHRLKYNNYLRPLVSGRELLKPEEKLWQEI